MYRFFSVVSLQTGYVMVKNPYNVHYCLNACLQWHLTMHIEILPKCLVGKGLTRYSLNALSGFGNLGLTVFIQSCWSLILELLFIFYN